MHSDTRAAYPDSVDRLHDTVLQLQERLSACTSEWKVVFGHHPIYTKGAHHRRNGVYLGTSGPTVDDIGMPQRGFGLEAALTEVGLTMREE